MNIRTIAISLSLTTFMVQPTLASSDLESEWKWGNPNDVQSLMSAIVELDKRLKTVEGDMKANTGEMKVLLQDVKHSAVQPATDEGKRTRLLEEQVKLLAAQNQTLRKWVGCFITVRKEKEREKQSMGGFPSESILHMMISDAPDMLGSLEVDTCTLSKIAEEVGLQLPKDETPLLVDLLQARAPNPVYEAYRAKHDEAQRKQAAIFNSSLNRAPPSVSGLSAKSVPGVGNTRK